MKFAIISRRAAAGLAVVGLALSAFVLPVRAEVKIEEVISPKGITAWLVEDQSDPIVTISFLFAGGGTQDPDGKEGLAGMMASLLKEGAGDLDTDAFQQRLYETGAQMSFASDAENVYGSIRMLAGETAEPLGLLSLALTSPRFDAASLARVRDIAISGIEARRGDPDQRGEDKLVQAFYGDHPLGRIVTRESLEAIGRDDILTLHGRTFARSNLFVGVAGAIDPQTLATLLDRVFGGLPAKADLKEIAPPKPAFGRKVFERYERPQSAIQLGYPGVGIESDDLYAARLVTYILGGGMKSRLLTELREKNGLTYGAYATLNADMGWGTATVVTSTGADATARVTGTIKDIARHLAEEGPTPEELADAKKYLVGSYALANLQSTSGIANTLVELQRYDLGRDYPNRQEELYGAVTLDQARAVARRLFSTDPTMLVVGPQDG